MGSLIRIEKKEQTRKSLIFHAEKLFALNGISNTSTIEITKILNVSHGTLFVHFPDREALVIEVVNNFVNRFSDTFNHKINENLSNEFNLKQLLKSHTETISEFEDLYTRLISEKQNLPIQVQEMLRSMHANWSNKFYRAAKIEMDKLEIKKISQVYFFSTWMSLLHFTLMNRDLFSKRKPIFKIMGDDLIEYFYQLIKL